MVKFYEGSFLFKFTWDQVAQGFWSRYPNPYSQHVLTEDVVAREVKDKRLISRRLLTKTNRVPKWGERFVSSRTVSIIEDSVVDPVTKTLTTRTKNIGYTKVLGVEEKCVYRQSSDNVKWTQVERQAWITSDLFGFARAIEAFGVERFRKNSQRAMYGFQYVLEHMFQPSDPNVDRGSGLLSKTKKTAKKATELAKATATPLVAACSAGNAQNS